ncbi:MAG: TerB family tellurite resistance protein [Desulfobacterales bacterium]|nr:TerB family tellurite resistance protein [Desulfobacterales bacterium]
MLDKLKRFFNKADAETAGVGNEDRTQKLRLATCALFLEMARIDEVFTAEEMETVLGILKDKYSLSGEEADDLVSEADRELEESVDLWQFARLINENYTVDEKIEIIETLWEMVFVDGKMDRHEHYLMNKLKNLLHLSQSQLIGAKLKVLHG